MLEPDVAAAIAALKQQSGKDLIKYGTSRLDDLLLREHLVMAVTNRLVAQSADMGALPALYAAIYPGLPGGSFIGPDGIGE